MPRPVLLDVIKQKILVSKTGSVFVAADFAEVSDKAKIGVCLSVYEIWTSTN